MLSKSPKEKVAWQGTPPRGPSKRVRAGTLGVFVVLIWLLTQKLFPYRLSSRGLSPSKSPYAYVTLLAPNPRYDNTTIADDDDEYFVATRVLAYQLLHAPQSATNSSIPFIVLCTPDIPESQLARLEKDGATVRVVERIGESWMKPGLTRWRDVMSKLRMLEMTEYEKLLFLDSDMYVTRRLDGVFIDPTTEPLQVNQSLGVEDEGPLPKSYIFSAQTYLEGRQHPYPYPPGPYLSSGFFVVQPCISMFNYYLSVAKIEGRFNSNAPEQNLFNYAHRKDGPMPWTEIYYKWTTTWPSPKEFEAGAATLHEKWWDGTIVLDHSLRQLWYAARTDMYAFHNASKSAA